MIDNNSFTIGRLAKRPPTFKSRTLLCHQVDNIFRQDPALTHIVIIDELFRVVGLLTKKYFYDKTCDPSGISLFADKQAEMIITSQFITIDESKTIVETICTVMQQGYNTQYDLMVITEKDEKFIGTVSISDLLERFQAELAKHRELTELANRSKNVFMAKINHEIRNPLNAIIGFSDILDTELSDPELRTYVSYIKNAGNVLLNLMNDILDLSQIDAGKLNIKCEKTVIADTLTEISNMFKWPAKNKNLDLFFEISEELSCPVMIDGHRVRQILIKLIENAIKFNDSGFVKVKAIFSSDKIIFIVEDAGIGIPLDQHARIFAPFNQCDGQDAAKYGGIGLGLTIARQLVQLMNGSIELMSEPDYGSTFTVELPLHFFNEKSGDV